MNIPEKAELFDERDRLRNEPQTEWARSQLRVVNFLIAIRRGTTGNMVLTQWQKEICDMYATAECCNISTNGLDLELF